MLASLPSVTNLFLQHESSRNQSEAIGQDHRPVSAEQTKHRPPATPLVNRLYIESEMERVSSVHNVLMACGKKLKVVSAAAT